MRVLVALSLPLLCAFAARIAFRDDRGGAIPPEVLQALSVPLVMGNVKGANESLLPGMVPPSGFEYRFTVKGAPTTSTNWSLAEVAPTSEAGTMEVSWKHPLALVHVECNWRSWSHGHRSHHVYSSADGQELFKIRESSRSWWKSKRRTSFRILPPGSKDDDEAIFTINEEINTLGIVHTVKKIIGGESVFRVYRGREKDNDVVLYAAGAFPNPFIGGMAAGAGGYTFYESELMSTVLARIDQNPMYGSMEYGLAAHSQNPLRVPDKFTLEVQPGVDAALVLASSVVMDIARDLGSNR